MFVPVLEYMCSCVRIYVCAPVLEITCAYANENICIYMFLGQTFSEPVCVYIYIYIYIYIYMYVCMYICIYICIYIYIYIHTYIYIYIYIYISARVNLAINLGRKLIHVCRRTKIGEMEPNLNIAICYYKPCRKCFIVIYWHCYLNTGGTCGTGGGCG